jgi:RNA polymerase sigma-70 factor (ECF subfamily)
LDTVNAADVTIRGLIQLAQSGDPGALEELILVHQDRVLRLAVYLLGDFEEAKDASQEILLRFCRSISRFDVERKIQPWLNQITVNVCRDYLRRRKNQPKISLEEWMESGSLLEFTNACDLESAHELREQQQLIMQALDSLSVMERSALVLRDLDGLTTREVAAMLGSSETTVRSQICSARLKIKKYRDKCIRRRS